MKILAVDTSTLTGSIALVESNEKAGLKVLGEVTLSVLVRHSERLMPAIERLLSDAEEELGNIDLFAAAHGPGSFTGLRIGLAAVQGFSLATGKPAFGVSSLEALALNGSLFKGHIIPILDARRGEVYAAVYCSSGKATVMEEKALPPEVLVKELAGFKSTPLLVLGQGAVVHRELIQKSLGDRVIFAPPPLNDARASNVALLALKEFQRVEGLPPLHPKYLRAAESAFPPHRTASRQCPF